MSPTRALISSIAACSLAFGLAPITGCQSTYYAAMESFGVHKRDILVDRVEDARTDPEEAKENASARW